MNLVDLMILVAATGVGAWLIHPFASVLFSGKTSIMFGPKPLYAMISLVWLAWTWGVLAIGLRAPRPRSRNLFRQPGLVAGIAAASCSAGCLGFESIYWFRKHAFSWVEVRIGTLVTLPNSVGPAVLGVWLAMWLGRHRRSEFSQVDLMGCLIGLGWIVFWLFYQFYFSIIF